MPRPTPSQIAVADDILLDGRLALFHQEQRWLAVADLHFGYELSQRAAGRLVPLWGMDSIEQRLMQLLADYQPRRLVIVGDLVHDQASVREAHRLLERIRPLCEPIVLAGNHDRHVGGSFPMLASWETDGFFFHHGHCLTETPGKIQIVGHHHPAGSMHDGAGLRLKLPAFVQHGNCWIMPAFSPWAGGVTWRADADSRVWLCSPVRILRLPEAEVPVS